MFLLKSLKADLFSSLLRVEIRCCYSADCTLHRPIFAVRQLEQNNYVEHCHRRTYRSCCNLCAVVKLLLRSFFLPLSCLKPCSVLGSTTRKPLGLCQPRRGTSSLFVSVIDRCIDHVAAYAMWKIRSYDHSFFLFYVSNRECARFIDTQTGWFASGAAVKQLSNRQL